MKISKKSNTLVSIIAITYNSSFYITDLLNSIFEQTYSNIELIISDDCSKDNTFEICKKWIDKHHKQFKNCTLTKTPHNKGIVGNYNHALKLATGEWIKYIAGDDILAPNCIEKFVKSTKNSTEKIHICGIISFNEKGEKENIIPNYKYFQGNSLQQLKFLLKKGTIIAGPSLFLERNTLISLGGFQKKYPFIEDYPLYMKYLTQGYRINLINDYLIYYRVHSKSLSHSNSDSRFASSIYNAIIDIATPLCWKNKMYLWWYHYKAFALLRKFEKEKGRKRKLAYLVKATDIIGMKKRFLNSNITFHFHL